MAQHSSTARMPALAAKTVDLAHDPQNRSSIAHLCFRSLHLSSGGESRDGETGAHLR